MKDYISVILAVIALIFSTIAITATFVRTSDDDVDAGIVTGNDLADGSITSGHIQDGTITNDDITNNGLSKIADNSIVLDDLTSEVLAEMSGVVEILDNSILGSKLANSSVSNRHIDNSADIDPSKIFGTAWTQNNDGADSGLDADTLDGIDSSEFARTGVTKTGYFTIPFCGLTPRDSDTSYRLVSRALENTDPGFVGKYFYAPLYLPDKAVITKITIRYDLGDSLASMSVFISKGAEFSNTLLESVYLPTTSNFENYTHTTSEIIIDQKMPYRLTLDINPNDASWDAQFAWATIEYQYTS